MSIEIHRVNLDDLTETWALRGHPTLIRRRWQAVGCDLDSDASVKAYCETADCDDATSLLVDLASMSKELALNRRAEFAAHRVCVCYPEDGDKFLSVGESERTGETDGN